MENNAEIFQNTSPHLEDESLDRIKLIIIAAMQEAVHEILKADVQSDRLLTTQDAANYLSIKVQTLSLWRSHGKGPSYIKLGGVVRYEMEVIRNYLQKRRVGISV